MDSKPSSSRLSWMELQGTKTPPPPYWKAGDFGGSKAATAASASSTAQKQALLYKGAMDLAKAPVSSIMMTAFMLYMTANSIQIFSAMMIGMSVINPIRAITSANSAFRKYEHPKISLILPKLIYVGLQVFALGIALNKCQKMGLIPSPGELFSVVSEDSIATVFDYLYQFARTFAVNIAGLIGLKQEQIHKGN